MLQRDLYIHKHVLQRDLYIHKHVLQRDLYIHKHVLQGDDKPPTKQKLPDGSP